MQIPLYMMFRNGSENANLRTITKKHGQKFDREQKQTDTCAPVEEVLFNFICCFAHEPERDAQNVVPTDQFGPYPCHSSTQNAQNKWERWQKKL